MPENTDTRPQRRRQAILSAVTSGGWLLISAALILMIRAHYVPNGIGSVIMAAAAGFEALMLIPLGFSLKARLQEIQGGEEDEARNY
jgi:predicted phage tail protein